jgi:hypothetical protein
MTKPKTSVTIAEAATRELVTQDQIDELVRKAETGEQWAEICRLEAALASMVTPSPFPEGNPQ